MPVQKDVRNDPPLNPVTMTGHSLGASHGARRVSESSHAGDDTAFPVL